MEYIDVLCSSTSVSFWNIYLCRTFTNRKTTTKQLAFKSNLHNSNFQNIFTSHYIWLLEYLYIIFLNCFDSTWLSVSTKSVNQVGHKWIMVLKRWKEIAGKKIKHHAMYFRQSCWHVEYMYRQICFLFYINKHVYWHQICNFFLLIQNVHAQYFMSLFNWKIFSFCTWYNESYSQI